MAKEQLTKEQFAEYLRETVKVADIQPERFNAALGVKVVDCGVEPMPYVEFTYEAQEAHLNPYGGVHGGIIASLADYCTGTGAVAYTQHFVTTVDLNVSYLRALTGSVFRIRVEYTHVGGRLISAMCWIRDAKTDELSATAQLNFMRLPEKLKGLQD